MPVTIRPPAPAFPSDAYGLNKLARLRANTAATNEANAQLALDPPWPFIVNPIPPSIWQKAMSGSDAYLILAPLQ